MNSQTDQEDKYRNKVLSCRILYVDMDLRTKLALNNQQWVINSIKGERQFLEKQSLQLGGNEFNLKIRYKCLSHEGECAFYHVYEDTIKLDMNISQGFQQAWTEKSSVDRVRTMGGGSETWNPLGGVTKASQLGGEGRVCMGDMNFEMYGYQ